MKQPEAAVEERSREPEGRPGVVRVSRQNRLKSLSSLAEKTKFGILAPANECKFIASSFYEPSPPPNALWVTSFRLQFQLVRFTICVIRPIRLGRESGSTSITTT